jgi:hypothetical protein
MIDRTAALRRKTDPAGADQYVENMRRLTADLQGAQAKDATREAHLTKLLSEYRAYQASFTAQQLAMPAVWGDSNGSARQAMEAQIAELQELSADEQERAGALREQSRDLEREAMASDKEAVALRLRTQGMDLLQDADHIRNSHRERAALEEETLRDAYELTNLKPGPAEHALAYKMDPTIPNPSQPGKIHVIVVSTSTLAEEDILQRPEQAARKAWLERVKESIDYTALAALLD